ncbi:MAG TPA: hypothetical protein VKV05_12830 [Terriglobales bacterium]|nr:hypothetical protein [Terriglobales bacterium]
MQGISFIVTAELRLMAGEMEAASADPLPGVDPAWFPSSASLWIHQRVCMAKSAAAVACGLAAFVLLVVLLSTPAAATDFCAGGILDQGAPLGQQGPDLVITNMTCTVDGTHAPYNFHNVYIFGSGTGTGALVFNDATMDFYAANILVQNQGVLQATGIGAGNDGHVLTIHLYGSQSDPGVTCKKMDNGSLVDDDTCGVPTSNPDVWDSNKMTTRYPTTPCTKTSQLNPPTKLPGGVDDCFYQYGKLDSQDSDNMYFGHKVLALSYGGTINFSGYKGAQGGDDNNPAVTGSGWMRLQATLTGNGSEQSLQVSGMPADWQHNDFIVVTSTDYLPAHSEQMQVDSISGSTVNLIGTVKYPHWGQVYSLANVPCKGQNGPPGMACEYGPDLLPGQGSADRNVDMRAAVGLLSRSIRIVSDGASAASAFTGYYGGHTIVRQGFLSYQVQGVEFYQLGQGGLIGHYPIHFHMDRITPPDTYVKDSSIWDSMTRWIVLHATSGVTLRRNVGYKSIGHGFYLEDGTETDNIIDTNLGVFARAAVQNPQNDRQVPGILAEPGDPGAPPPYHSDWEFPTVFWIMNGWNDFQYNFASAAGTCGVCYWLLPGGISSKSQFEWFDGYAGQQYVVPDFNTPAGLLVNRAGLTPLKSFVGNTCSTAMTSLLNIGETSPCAGVSNIPNSGTLLAVNNPNAPAKGRPGNDDYYPYITGLRNPTLCTGEYCRCDPGVTGCNAPCAAFGPSEANCAVTTVDRYTSSFNWAQKNFAAVWLRPWWFLVQNSAITDVQQGGLTFVTSGGYTRADIAQGYWSLLRKSVLIGNTQLKPDGSQPANAFANSAGPFNPSGLSCDQPAPPGVPFCLSAAQGISYPTDFFSVNQKLFSIYDGPAYEEHNAYLDIPVSRVGNKNNCTNNGTQQICSNGYLYGLEFGVTADPAGPPDNPSCYLPNAAIGWKQSNGFFYPPAFHSDSLYFNNVDIRHFVIEPQFLPGTFQTDPQAVKTRYCTWKTDMFANFTDVDRQTVLNDDDGSLTGLLADLGAGNYEESLSVNEDSFFNAPKVTTECASDVHDKGIPATDPPGTADTSPYEYVTTATIAKCGINKAGCRVNLANDIDCSQGNSNQYCAWGDQCTAGIGPTACYGVPLYRQLLTDQEWTQYTGNPNFQRPAIRMMGQATGQRSTLTVNHAHYYIDDQVSKDTQQGSGATELNVYMPNQTYFTYFIYAKADMDQTYQMFVGYGLNKQMVLDSVKPYRVILNDQNYQFNQATGPSFLTVTYDDRPLQNGGTGLVTVRVQLAAYADEFNTDRPKFCQPASYCVANGDQCRCAPGTQCTDNSVCVWAIKDIDCPLAGCFAFGITMPGSFQTGIAKPPVPQKFIDDKEYNWLVPFELVDKGVSGAQCNYTQQP